MNVLIQDFICVHCERSVGRNQERTLVKRSGSQPRATFSSRSSRASACTHTAGWLACGGPMAPAGPRAAPTLFARRAAMAGSRASPARRFAARHRASPCVPQCTPTDGARLGPWPALGVRNRAHPTLQARPALAPAAAGRRTADGRHKSRRAPGAPPAPRPRKSPPRTPKARRRAAPCRNRPYIAQPAGRSEAGQQRPARAARGSPGPDHPSFSEPSPLPPPPLSPGRSTGARPHPIQLPPPPHTGAPWPPVAPSGAS